MMFLLLFAALTTPPEFTLPAGVTPRRHAIEMTIDPSAETFSGYARIDVTLAAAQPEIWINGRELSISESWVEVKGKRIAAKTELAGGEFIGVTPEQAVGPGDVTIAIRYLAPLSAKEVSGPNRKKVGDDWYVFTTFTPTDARRAFPCFDEPRFKTPWEIAIHIPRGQRAFSNAPELPGSDATFIHFAPTQPISAEVVAFAVGPFEVLDGGTAGEKHTPVRVIAGRGQLTQAKEAALATQQVLPRLEKYTGIPYPWEKLDHVALPKGAFGAVENPGLITYQSAGLLVPPAAPEGVRRIEAHEIGHQWFGNLVTQADWTDVWLSEGFATWISAKMMDEEQPADRRRVAAVVARERMMAADSGPKTHPVRWEMHNRKELDNVYNQFPYQKGAAILLMLENWIGEEKFQQGLRAYLADHRMGNATTRDLESELPAQATPVMESMLNSTGVPVITATCDGEALIFDREGPGPVPVCWKTAGGSGCVRTDQPRTTVVGTTCQWIFPNANGAGYYRVAWTDPQLDALSAGGLSQLNGAERLTLAYDLQAQKSKHAILKLLAADPLPEIQKAATDGHR